MDREVRERERVTQIERQKERERDRQTDRQTDRYSPDWLFKIFKVKGRLQFNYNPNHKETKRKRGKKKLL